jgi:hypothetical protein
MKSQSLTSEATPANVQEWLSYVAGLPWKHGSLDASSYNSALKGAEFRLPQAVVLGEIRRRIEKAGDAPKEGKINSQVLRAYDYVNKSAGKSRVWVPKSRFREAVLRRIASNLPIRDIHPFIASRSAIAPERVTAEGFLQALYCPGERVLLFTVYESQGQALWPACGPTLPTRGDDGVWYLANPVDGKWHYNPRQNTKSRRSEESVTNFRFAVLESDEADLNDWLRCLAQMPLRIAAIYESGGRSIHALVQVDAKTKAEWDNTIIRIKHILVTLGADPCALTAVRLSRLPQAKRGSRLQTLIYLAPNPDAVPIYKRQPRHV